ncbi:MAG TPA: leucine--tRNA ligase [Blastocatellia bacterium]|nr:leucine--tRNA ligase [Blastocatellia bacterium]
MDEKYFPQQIEKKWQQRWAEQETFKVTEDPTRKKFYCLEMLAYTSGRAHIGHVSNFAIGDALAWYKRLRGFNVLHPFGWDAFGQPAETAAIKDGTDPEKFTRDAIAYMKWQFQRMGLSYDWSRELATCDPEYYKWNQWFFIRMWERGMIYRKLSPVNWCPKENISLSNEQAANGVCWRDGTPVVQKELMQWFARITDYAGQLLDSLDQLESGWPERVVAMQRNWIGRSYGAEVTFKVEDSANSANSITVFTTRIDTIFGANAIILAPEHPLLNKLVEGKPQRDEVLAFADRLKQQQRSGRELEELDKEGIFTGAYAINPFNGERLPIWVANFVLIQYGTGAIMSVPSGDQRDFEFSRKYGLPFRQIKLTSDGVEIVPEDMKAADDEWTTTVNTGEWSGLSSKQANRRMTEYAEAQGFGRGSITYKLRDWGISRQRYWGTPVPMIHCDTCGIVPVPDDQLPVVLPRNVNLNVVGGSPLDHVPDYLNVSCPKCGSAARRDTDTMDTFVDSCWYYFRYCDPHNDRMPFDPKVVEYWMPVDQYIGGVEHAVLHLIYTRYWTKVMRDLGLVKFDEPVTRLLTQGMVCKETFQCPNPDHDWLFPEQVTEDKKCKLCGNSVKIGRVEKMSKSRKNAVDPIEMIDIHGADSLRLFVLFAGPPDKDKEWSDTGFEGAARYLQRVWRVAFKLHCHLDEWGAARGVSAQQARETLRVTKKMWDSTDPESSAGLNEYQRRLQRRMHQVIRSITENFEERLHLNTCISSLMELTNELYAFDQAVEKNGPVGMTDLIIGYEALESLIRMLAPFAPHIAEELWEAFGHSDSVAQASWPEFSDELAREEEIEVAVQVNGKLRSRLFVAADLSDEDLREAALIDEKVQAAISGHDIVKVIVVPRKLVNIVIK